MKKVIGFCSILLLLITAISQPVAFAQCGTPVTGVALNITQNSATISLYCSCSATGLILEYGPAGFTPGTGAAAGPGGTAVSLAANTNSYTFTGLASSTAYDYYSRLSCGGGIYTANNLVKTFTTAFNCPAAPAITCGSMVNVTTTTGNGAWYTCTYADAKEKIFSFTPSVSGTHYLVSPYPNIQVYFSFKAASQGCNDANWSCIGTGMTTKMNQLAFGPLTAGTQYYILVDPYSPNFALNANFRIECPYCSPPGSISVSTTPYSATVNWTGSTCVIEYGVPGFTPGAGATAGSASSAVVTGGSGITINNLNDGTIYEYYLRTSCIGGNYSPNSIRGTFITSLCLFEYPYFTLGSVMSLDFNGTPLYPTLNNCFQYTPGSEKLVTFIPPSSGYYNLRVTNGNYSNGFGYTISSRVYNPICNLAGYSGCLSPSWSSATDNYTIGPLSAGTTYEFLLDVEDTSSCQMPPCSNYIDLIISCPSPSNINISNIQPNQVTATFSCNCPAATYLEYGPSGFTPGTGSVAGVNGTLITGVSSPYVLSGLTTDTKYDLYFRSDCGGNFTTNSAVISIRTPVDCSTASSLACNSNFSYSVNATGPLVGGSWSLTACTPASQLAREGIWSFTPTQTGVYSLLNYSMFANSYNYYYPISVYLKAASLGCNEQNWNCMGNISQASVSFTSGSVSLGTLTAGTTYLIMMDGIQPTFTAGYSYSFQLICPSLCASPQLVSTTGITQTSATVDASCSNCSGNYILEYGPAGFTPGTGAGAGIGGTAISVTAFPFNLTGLTAGTTYDVYARQNCGSGSISSNCPKLTFSTVVCNVEPSYITSSISSGVICSGSSVTLTQNGGVPAAGGSMKWYSGSCGGTAIGTGNSITVSPTATTVYYVRAEASCGNSICKSLTITVNALPAAPIAASGPVTFCAGNSVTLNANTGPGLTYQWKKYNNLISGATTSSYVASTTGNYKCIITNSSGCSRSSNSILVTVNPLPTASITAAGPTTFCAGDSVILNANAGSGLTYQWKKYTNLIAGATAISYSVKTSGKYRCVVSNSFGCFRTSNSIVVDVPCRETTPVLSDDLFELYPNPSTGSFTISATLSKETVSVVITDITGRIIQSYDRPGTDYLIVVDGLRSGLYYVTAFTENEYQTRRMAVIK